MRELPPPEPWLSFFREIDERLRQETQIHCLGGFVVTVIYGADRPTVDLDALSLVKGDITLWEVAGVGSDLHRQHHLYRDRVGIVTLPEDYEDRIAEVFGGVFTQLQIFALDPYDVALAKIERNSGRDREDVRHLARVVPFDLEVLSQRYHDELRVYLGNPERAKTSPLNSGWK